MSATNNEIIQDFIHEIIPKLKNENNDTPTNKEKTKPPNRNEYFKNYMRQYYYTNRKELVNCKYCDKDVMKCSLLRHQRSDKCQALQRKFFNI